MILIGSVGIVPLSGVASASAGRVMENAYADTSSDSNDIGIHAPFQSAIKEKIQKDILEGKPHPKVTYEERVLPPADTLVKEAEAGGNVTVIQAKTILQFESQLLIKIPTGDR